MIGEPLMFPEELDEEMVEDWKAEVISAHKESGHDFVMFDHRVDVGTGQFSYRIKNGGYEDDYPDWLAEESGVHIYDIEAEEYVE